MLAGLLLLCAPHVDAGTAKALIAVESAFNPNAIGVVAGILERKPHNRAEAIATAHALRAAGWNFSIGLAQINVHNLDRFGLSIADGFEPCKNLQAMQRILGDCYQAGASNADPQLSLRRALSCYYSGNFTTGFRNGYVSRVVSNARKTVRAPP